MNLLFILLAACLANTFCSGDGMICVMGNENPNDKSQSCFTISSRAHGWVGFGFGGMGMDGAEMYVGFRNFSSGYTIANLIGMGHGPPQLPGFQNVIPSPLVVSSSTIKDFAFSFCRSNKFGAEILPFQTYIYAYSERPPIGNIDSPAALLGMHDYFSFFEADFTGFSDGRIDEDDFDLPHPLSFLWVVLIHGLLMWIAWVVLPLVAIFIARYMKKSRWWLISLGSIIFILTLIAFVLVAMYKKKHFNNFHSASGFLSIIFVACQAVVGFVISQMFDKGKFKIPYQDKIHWWVVRVLMVFKLITIQTGFNAFVHIFGFLSIWLVLGHYLLVFFAIAAMFFGEYMGLFKHQKRAQHKVKDKITKEKIKDILKRKAKTDKEIQNIRYRNASHGLEKEIADLGFDVDTSDSDSDSDSISFEARNTNSTSSQSPHDLEGQREQTPESDIPFILRPEPAFHPLEPNFSDRLPPANMEDSGGPHNGPRQPFDSNLMPEPHPMDFNRPPPVHMGAFGGHPVGPGMDNFQPLGPGQDYGQPHNHGQMPGPHPMNFDGHPPMHMRPFGGGPGPEQEGQPHNHGQMPGPHPMNFDRPPPMRMGSFPGPGQFNRGPMPPFNPMDFNPANMPPHMHMENLEVKDYDYENFPLEEIHKVESLEVIRYSGYNRNFSGYQ
jgi:Eukaryotic cytochrome b561